jgi:hypothetical protein
LNDEKAALSYQQVSRILSMGKEKEWKNEAGSLTRETYLLVVPFEGLKEVVPGMWERAKREDKSGSNVCWRRWISIDQIGKLVVITQTSSELYLLT